MKILFTLLCVVVLLAACGEDAKAPETDVALPKIHANQFLSYVNKQASLPAGNYQLVIRGEDALSSANYQITLMHHDVTQTFEGDWIAGQQSLETFTLPRSGGLEIVMNSNKRLELQIKRDGFLMAPTQISDGINELHFKLNASNISNIEYSEAYYRLVDPDGTRTTLKDWKATNNFDQGNDTFVVFRDTKDLGYGRSMTARQRSDGGAAIQVDNYVVALSGPSPANYGPLNTHAAVDKNGQFLAGTNAIEFSPLDQSDINSPMVAKFFIFAPPDEQGVQHRILEANLDGRGMKPVPTTCISCHGGLMLPLDENGHFQAQSILSAKLNQLEVESFEFSPISGYTLADQNERLREINQIVASTFTTQQNQQDIKGHWSADFALDLIEGRYKDDLVNGEFDPNYIPEGWLQQGNRPAGVETLYKAIIEPHCISCHSLRGTEIGEATTVNVDGDMISLANAVNFSSYEKFISMSDRIIDYVYRRGQMPLSLRNYEKFWQNPQGKPTLLASFLPNFDVFDETGQVIQPQRPYAKTLAPSQLVPPSYVIGEHSLFAETFQWRVVDQPADATLVLGALDQSNLEIQQASMGEYQFELIVTNEQGNESAPSLVTVNVVADDDLTQITFDNQIRDIMGASDNSSCSLCHRANSSYPNIPAYYADSNPQQYAEVRARVDFADPTNSPILVKPMSAQHGGAIVMDRSTLEGESQYQTFVDWILAGAPCGTDSEICQQ